MLKILFVTIALMVGLAGAARADDPPVAPAARVDSAKLAFDQIEATLTRGDLSDGTLQKLRSDLDPLSGQIAALVADLGPRLEAVKARLAQLGPKPGDKDPPEPADVSAERAAQEKLLADLDATIKRARVLGVQISQTSQAVMARRRALFAHALLVRSQSIADPDLWVSVVRDVPADIRATLTLTSDWLSATLNRLTPWHQAALFALLAGIPALYWPAWQLCVRIRTRAEGVAPSRLGRAVAAVRVMLATAATPAFAVLALTLVLVAYDLPSRFEPLLSAFDVGVLAVAVLVGLARGYLAPKSPGWRLPTLPTDTAKTLYRLTISISTIAAVSGLIDAQNEVIGAAVTTSVANRAVAALLVAAAILDAMRKAARVWRRRLAENADVTLEHWRAILRLFGWVAVVILTLAVLVGYVALASFLIEQVMVLVATLALLHLALVLTEEGLQRLFDPARPLGRAIVVTAGLRNETLDQVAILLSGLTRVLLFIVAILLILAPWRIESGDMLGTVEAAFFGFSVGEVRISLASIAVAGLLLAGCIAGARAVQSWLAVKFLPRTRLDTGLQASIKTSLGYVGVILGLFLSLSHLGFSFERIAIVAGALSVGIGLGLQSVVNNFVSGLILLWERAVRVGDWIAVGEEQGYVRRINVRSTEIETFERALVIMPNSSLVTGVVKNWVRNDRVGRIKLPFTLPLAADPETVRQTLVALAKANPLVLAIPVPQAYFTALTDTALKFDLVCFIEDVESSVRVTSDLLFSIHAEFKSLGLIVPPAPPVVTSPALDKLDAWLSARTAASPDGSGAPGPG